MLLNLLELGLIIVNSGRYTIACERQKESSV